MGRLSSKDPFVNDFIKASQFASKKDSDIRLLFQHVTITDSHLLASDGIRLIVLKSDAIPDNLKNTKIPWDVREDFQNHIADIQAKFPDYDYIVADIKTGAHHGKFKATDFFKKFETVSSGLYRHNQTVEVNFSGKKIGFVKTFLEDALKAFGDSDIDLYVIDAKTPILMENEKIMVMLSTVFLGG